MRAFVFNDRALERQAGRFVWLSIDAEKDRNAGFLERYPIEAYPTLLVIDARTEQAALRWIGGATVAQLQDLLQDGERAARGEGSGVEAALARADRLLGANRGDEAASAYREVLAEAPRDWPERDRAVESLLSVLEVSGSNEECVELARAELPRDRSPHFATVALAGLSCALGLEPTSGLDRAPAIHEFETAARSAAGEPTIDLPADDRSSLYGTLVEAREDAGDEKGAHRDAAQWLAFLDAEAARAPTPRARAVFDSHRLSAALALGEPERVIPALRQSENDFPDDYNPPARLAVAYLEAGRVGDALAASDRALRLAYGPRKLRVYWTRADVLDKKGDREAEAATLRDALRYANNLPPSRVPEKRLEPFKKRLATMDSPDNASP
jgi:tetratricopeptide (TPR) repeat protein